MKLELTRADPGLAFVAVLVVVAALAVGYATAARGYGTSASTVTSQLKAVRTPDTDRVALAKLSLTERLQPASLRKRSAPAQTTAAEPTAAPTVQQPVTPVVTPVKPVVKRPVKPVVKPTTPRRDTEPSGGTKTFDSSG